MFKTKASQAPWMVFDISKETNSFGHLEIRAYSDTFEEDKGIATVWLDDDDIEEMRANLVLMVKAPEMFELLIKSYEQFKDAGNKIMAKSIQDLLADICKENIKVQIGK